MKFREQTAIEGIFSAATLNLGARVLVFFRQVVITTFFGLSAGLDAYYIAMTIMGIFIMILADIFDSLGIPSLVRALESEGEDGFNRVAASIFRLAVYLSLGLSALMLLTSHISPFIASGFTPDKRALVTRNLLILFPAAACYLPYHALGSFFRARRHFQVFYLAELAVSAVGLVVLIAWHKSPDIVAGAWSISYICGALFLYLLSRNTFGRHRRPDRDVMARVLRNGVKLLPIYSTSYLYLIVDRFFSSYLPTGSVSALSYGLMLCMLLPGIINMENVFVTPLAETGDWGELLEWILKGVALFCIPIMAFSLCHAVPIVRAIFERGSFTSASTSMTASALSCYTLALPSYLIMAICTRLFMIIGNIRPVIIASFAGVAVNGALNLILTVWLGLGLRGVALSTAVTNTLLAVVFLYLVDKRSPIVGERYVTGAILPGCLAAGVALALTGLIPPIGNRFVDVSIGGILFVCLYLGGLKILPIPELRRLENIIFRAFFKREIGGEKGA